MDKEVLKQYALLMDSAVDADAVMGLRGAQGFFKSSGLSMEHVLLYAEQHLEAIRAAQHVVEHEATDITGVVEEATSTNTNTNGAIPDFASKGVGVLEITFPGSDQNNSCTLPECAQDAVESIAISMKDAVVAAIINQCRLKIKLFDVKGDDGKIIETIVRVEYDRDGMLPINLWSGIKGEAGTIASILRPFIKASLPNVAA